jgi:hypothetical protein
MNNNKFLNMLNIKKTSADFEKSLRYRNLYLLLLNWRSLILVNTFLVWSEKSLFIIHP